jgi:DNA invertase Pin-like site-specific DNA recombinase
VVERVETTQSDSTAPPIPVAEYVRMSTEHQRYSTENQSQTIREYAKVHGMEVVRSYADEGKSGLNIGGREGLQTLIRDVQEGAATYRAILVYDVSRWGRFQDVDESAHYEYLCTKAGIRVIYCAEQFTNDGSPVSAIIKSVKRAMAGEYSRELSNKVFTGQCRLIELGFRQGGPAGYGLRRQLLNEQRQPKEILGPRQYKSIQTDRVVLIPGPQEEVAVVHRIYRDFVEREMREAAIAAALNAEGLLTDLGRPWTRGTVHQILINEKYIGNNVYNRVSFKLKKRRVKNTSDQWIRREGAFEGIISKDLFDCAKQLILRRSHHYDDAELLDLLRRLYERAGDLSGLIIDEEEGMPSSAAYRSRFGGLVRAYNLIGVRTERDFRYLEINRALRQWRPAVIDDVVSRLRRVGAIVERDLSTDLLTVNREWTASVLLARCKLRESGSAQWRFRFDRDLKPDITIAVRMDTFNQAARDYYVIPWLDMGAWPQNILEGNGPLIDSYRFEDLGVIEELAERSSIKEAA